MEEKWVEAGVERRKIVCHSSVRPLSVVVYCRWMKKKKACGADGTKKHLARASSDSHSLSLTTWNYASSFVLTL